MIQASARKNLYAIAMTYAGATGQTLAKVSREFYGNAGFFEDFKDGKQSITLSRLEIMLLKFSAAWPSRVQWPATDPMLMERPKT